MNIIMTGSHGFIAKAILPTLESKGHNIFKLVRSATNLNSDERFWNPYKGELDRRAVEDVEAVIHLAGESIAEGRWTSKKKQRILESRTMPTRFLTETIAASSRSTKVFICASAIGYYGDRGEEILTEDSSPGTDFLANVCREWEAATSPLLAKGIRVVNLRFGLILSPSGGALAKLLLPFKFSVGGKLGSGKQYWSWIAIDDVVGAIHHTLMNDNLNGPVNIVAPHAVTNQQFTNILGRVLSRPTIFPAPSIVLRLVLGEMADALLLSSTRVEPRKLISTQYKFQHIDLTKALHKLLSVS